MAYEFQHHDRTLLADETGGYRAGHSGPLMDSYRILEEKRSDLGDDCYETVGHVSVKRSIPVEKDGAVNPAFVHALRYALFPDYAAHHDDMERERRGRSRY